MTARRTLRLYTRPGCHLCDDARTLLKRLAYTYPFTVDEVDITVDQDAFLRYCFEIPVVAIGESIVPAAVDEARVRSVLDWEFRDEHA